MMRQQVHTSLQIQHHHCDPLPQKWLFILAGMTVFTAWTLLYTMLLEFRPRGLVTLVVKGKWTGTGIAKTSEQRVTDFVGRIKHI